MIRWTAHISEDRELPPIETHLSCDEQCARFRQRQGFGPLAPTARDRSAVTAEMCAGLVRQYPFGQGNEPAGHQGRPGFPVNARACEQNPYCAPIYDSFESQDVVALETRIVTPCIFPIHAN